MGLLVLKIFLSILAVLFLLIAGFGIYYWVTEPKEDKEKRKLQNIEDKKIKEENNRKALIEYEEQIEFVENFWNNPKRFILFTKEGFKLFMSCTLFMILFMILSLFWPSTYNRRR
jgi:flagellar basal body-associated protein FliL